MELKQYSLFKIKDYFGSEYTIVDLNIIDNKTKEYIMKKGKLIATSDYLYDILQNGFIIIETDVATEVDFSFHNDYESNFYDIDIIHRKNIKNFRNEDEAYKDFANENIVAIFAYDKKSKQYYRIWHRINNNKQN